MVIFPRSINQFSMHRGVHTWLCNNKFVSYPSWVFPLTESGACFREHVDRCQFGSVVPIGVIVVK
jgi:hypothetical protein